MTEAVDKIRESWQYKAVRATGGNKSKLGLIVLAVIGQSPKSLPMISLQRGAVISVDGFVIADAMLAGQIQYKATTLGSVRDVVDNFRGLADHLKLSDADREAMFSELKKWMATDLRAHADLGDWRVPKRPN